MKATLTIQMDNAAFGDDANSELERILHKLAAQVQERTVDSNLRIPVMDFNGNKVGSLTIEED